MADIQEIKKRVDEADIPMRELGSRSGISYSRVCDAFRGWVELKDPELTALEHAVNAAIRTRADHFNKMLASVPAHLVAASA